MGILSISVICPVFNTNRELLLAASRSVLDEDKHYECELILVDDASTDQGTLQTLRMLATLDRRVKVVRADRNRGAAAARNLGIAAASCEWVAFIDSDDLWTEGRLDLFRQARLDYPDAAWIASQQAMLDGTNKLVPGPRLAECPNGGRTVVLATPEATKALIDRWQHIGASIITKSALTAAGGFDESLRYGEDWLFFLRLSLKTPIVVIDAVTYILRRQGESLMRSSGRLTRNFNRAPAIARRLPELRAFRRELRWFHYGTCKDLAMNNLLNDRPVQALRHAMAALCVSPKDLKEFAFFCRKIMAGRSFATRLELARYSAAEQIDLVALTGTVPRYGTFSLSGRRTTLAASQVPSS